MKKILAFALAAMLVTGSTPAFAEGFFQGCYDFFEGKEKGTQKKTSKETRATKTRSTGSRKSSSCKSSGYIK